MDPVQVPTIPDPVPPPVLTLPLVVPAYAVGSAALRLMTAVPEKLPVDAEACNVE